MGNKRKLILARLRDKPVLSLPALLLLLLLLASCKSSASAPEPVPEEPELSYEVLELETYEVLDPVGDFVITYYDVCVTCCGKTDGITASGAVAAPYETCAVDPAVIPLGSTVLVKYGDGTILRLRAEDTGKGVRGNHIDVCVAGHQEAKALGVRRAVVYLVERQEEESPPA